MQVVVEASEAADLMSSTVYLRGTVGCIGRL